MSSHASKQVAHTSVSARVRRGLWVLLLLLPLWWASSAHAQQAVPALTAPVIDQTNTLSSDEIQALSNKILAYEEAKGSQIVVLMVTTTQPEDIAAYAYRVASTWKIGRRDVGDGVLVVVAKDDRRTRIEVAKDLEGAIPDLMAARILDTAMKPRFRAGDFAGGLSSAVDMITARLDGEELPEVTQDNQELGSRIIFLLFGTMFALFTLGTILKPIMGRRLGSGVSGIVVGILVFMIASSFLIAIVAAIIGFFVAWLTTSNVKSQIRRNSITIGGSNDWGGGSGGFGGGGGWGSGGGGDFGGGGASGDW